jgi:hypothetical protein
MNCNGHSIYGKVKAFTLVELVVAMVLAIIVIGIAYYAIQINQRSFSQAGKSLNKGVEVLQLQTLLKDDFSLAERIEWNSSVLRIFSHSGEFLYSFQDSIIVRDNQMITDTFRFSHYSVETSFLFDSPPLVEKINIAVAQDSILYFNILARAAYSNQLKFKFGLEKTDSLDFKLKQ